MGVLGLVVTVAASRAEMVISAAWMKVAWWRRERE
jgi:hypothetical protein